MKHTVYIIENLFDKSPNFFNVFLMSKLYYNRT